MRETYFKTLTYGGCRISGDIGGKSAINGTCTPFVSVFDTFTYTVHNGDSKEKPYSDDEINYIEYSTNPGCCSVSWRFSTSFDKSRTSTKVSS